MRNRRILLALVTLSLVAASAVPALAGPDKVSPLLRKYTNPELRVAVDPLSQQEAVGVLGAAEAGLGVRCLIQGDVTRSQLEALGVTVTSQAGPVFSAYIPPSAINAVSDLPGLVRIQDARVLRPNLDAATAETRIIPKVHGGTGPAFGGNTGAGVYVGIVDSGFDYKHSDFRTSGGQSRFVNIWDQTSSTGIPPAGYGYGTEYGQVALDGNTATITNPDGHGTHVTGIAGGNGSGTGNGQPAYRYTGVAPEATLVGVKTNFTDAGIIDGVSYIFGKAATAGVPAVVNLSLGGQFGPHDGTDPLDVGVSSLTGPGKIVVASAGNERGAQIHARGTLPAAGSPSVLEFRYTVDSYSVNPGTQNDLVLFDGYYESTDNYTVTVVSPTGQTLTVTRGNVNAIDTADGAIQIENGNNTNTTGDYEVFIAIFDYLSNHTPKAGVWKIQYTRVASTGSYVDLWNYVNSGNIGGRFTTNFTDDVTIGSPGSGLDVVTVAAYTTKTTWLSINGSTYSYTGAPPYGEIASFSSRGPLRDGTMKPDISGPGFGVMSTLASDVSTAGNEPLIDPDGKHWMQAGTSMSSPMVTGLVALMLNKYGALTPAQVKTKLFATARTDAYTGAVPNADWGYGKMDGSVADMTPPTVAVTAPNGGESYSAGQNVNITWTASDNFTVNHVDLYYSTDGGATFPNLIASNEPNDGSYTWVAPSVYTTMARVRVVAYDQVDNSANDASDANFTIQAVDNTPPSVTVTAPDGGEVFADGTVTNITWNASDTGAKPSGVTGAAAVIAGVDSVTISYSVDAGANWSVIAHGEDNDGTYAWAVPATYSDSALVRVQAYDPSGNVGSDQSDAYFQIISATAVPDGALPAVLTLAQNRPNPVAGAPTRISFGLTREGPVTLRIYNAAGREVAVLADGTLPAGFHTVTWNGETVDGVRASAGMYFYRLQTAEGTMTRKLMLLR